MDAILWILAVIMADHKFHDFPLRRLYLRR